MAVLLTAVVAIGSLSIDMALPSLPATAEDLGAQPATVQLTVTLFLAAFALAQLLHGPLSDRIGRRRVLLGGLVVYVIGGLACWAAPSARLLVAGRLLQALGAGSGPVVGRAVVRDLYEPEPAARVLGYMGTAMALTPILAPILGGVIHVAFGWRAVYLALATFGALFLGVAARLVPETNRRRDPDALRPGHLATNAADLLGDRAFLGYTLVVALMFGGQFAFISGSSFVLIEVLAVAPDVYGLCFGLVAFGIMTGSFLAARLARRMGIDRLIAAATSLGAVAGGVMAALAWGGVWTVAAVIGPMYVFAVGVGVVLPTATAGAIGPFPRTAGLASAVLGFLQLTAAAAYGIAVGRFYEGTPVPMAVAIAAARLAAATGVRVIRLFRKYAAVLILLVGGVLLLSSLVNLYFSYQETKAALVRLQRQQALAGASRIEQFVQAIERQVRAAMEVPFEDAAMAREQREIDFLRLLRDVPAISEIVQLDGAGKVQLLVSRFVPNEIGSQRDLSRDPRFMKTRVGRTYFGPVYFRNESEPYLTVAVPWGEDAPEVAAAEVNLKAIRDVISQIRVGVTGYAYVIDQRGILVAHPDMSFVLQKRDLSGLPQIREARAVPGAREVVTETAGLQGGRVLTSHAAIEQLGWLVFAEQPLAEAFAPLQGAIVLSAIFFVVGLGLSVLASVVLARRMVEPIRVLQEGAARIGAGELGHRLDVRTGDELETLGEEFNRTAAQLEESYANLEQKVETRTRELADANAGLSEALEHQTATSEVLKVISRSTFDLQPVLETLIENATRLCGATRGHIHRCDDEVLRFAASYGATPEFVDWLERNPVLLGPGSVAGRAASERRTVHVRDVLVEPGYQMLDLQRLQDYRTALAVPMLREDALLGVLTILKTKAEPFTQRNIELVTTFADQAVIAIENVRLLQELQARTAELARSVEELRALGEVGQAVNSTLDLETVLNTIVARAVQLSNTNGGALYEYDEATQEFSRIRGAYGLDDDLGEVLRATPLRLGEGAAGKAAARQAPVQVADVLAEGTYDVVRVRAIFERRGYRSLLAVPLLFERHIVGVLVVWGREPGSFAREIVDLLQTLATQSVLAIQNARLFREIADKGRQLEAASRHKSEFLANMSHELRTPLNAILGFNEMILGQVYGDVPPDLREPLTDIQNSGKHLLRLINNVLDLSKIEAGRMELALTDYAVQDTVERVRASLHPLAAEKGLEFVASVPEDIPLAYGDAGRITQCLMNLAGNALKFTRQGRVGISVDLQGDLLVYRVADTGIGIAEDKIETVFAEFRQGDATITSEFGGTGLGLSITRKFVEMHRGRIWVESELGKGSTFSFAVPLRLAGGKAA